MRMRSAVPPENRKPGVGPSGLLLLAAVLASGATAADAAATSGFADRALPNVEVRSVATRKDVRLPAELAGRPAVILVASETWSASCAGAEVAAALQRDYATWFSWVGVLSGRLTATEVERINSLSPFRLDRLYQDRLGLLKVTLGLQSLPVLLLVDADGTVRESCPLDGDATRLAEAARALWNTAGPSRWRRTGFEDFRLPRVGGTDLVSFLDVAGEEGTMVAFLSSRCLACARELEVLDFARHRRGGRVSFVAVFIDPAPDSRVRGFLAAAGATPDFVLRDPDFRLAGRYAIRTAPALLVINALGEIVFSRVGYREEHRDELYASITRAFDETRPPAGEASVIGEARRLHEDACSFLREGKPGFALLYQERIRELLPAYPSVNLRIAEAALAGGHPDLARESLTRYLAADPQNYDAAAVRQMISGIAAPAP